MTTDVGQIELDFEQTKTKICTKCDVEKTLDCYYKEKRGKFGVVAICIDCSVKYQADYSKNNKDKIAEKGAEYRKNNKDKIAKKKAEYRKNNKDKIYKYQAEYRKNNKDKLAKINAEYRKNKKDKIAEYLNQKRKTDIKFKLRHNLRKRVRDALKGKSKSAFTMELIGCSIEDLKLHLESKFTEGMSWDNYGKFGWHIDHKKPCASFNLEDPEQQKKCFHYTNLQPLWWRDNLSKHDKLPVNSDEIQKSLDVIQ